ncbi:PIN domain-containing protein [Actinoplanes sp. NPDC049118]|uniref:tetratricopeptide repeat protein n=1 Tax=Actinoplanes sp. NPDC049118 TaxID=3155769 RepID=UPI0033E46AC0
MEPAVSSALAKAAGSAAGPVTRLIGRATIRWRVAWTVARQARKIDITLSWKTLRRWMAQPDVQDQLRLGSAERVATAVLSLALLLGGNNEQHQADAEKVLLLIFAAFLRAQDPSTAAAIASEWQVGHTRSDGDATRAAVAASERSIISRVSASGVFNEQVRTLQPWRRKRAVELRGSWLTIEQVVQAVVSASSRGDLLRQWGKQPPEWLADAPADAVCWLAELASDYGQGATAFQLFATGVQRGAFPDGYWRSRQVMSLADDESPEIAGILEAATDQHPLARCLIAIHREEWPQAEEALASWTTQSPPDIALRLQLSARLQARAGNANLSIKLALEAADIDGAAGAAILAAELLLSRARFGQTVHKLADSEQAAALAVKARNARRAWLGDSVAAILVAVKALALAGNTARALALINPAPEGEATEAEAADPRLRREATELAAATGQHERALGLAAELGNPFVTAEVTALELMDRGNTSEAVAAWRVALDAADNDNDILLAVRGLAELGAQLPDLAELERLNPNMMREIRIVQQAMSAETGNLEALRAGAGQSLSLTVKLAERYNNRGEKRMSAEVLKAGAERWSDPQLMLMAARNLRDAGDLEAATRTAELALTMGGPSWAGQFNARALLFEIHTDTGAWDQAIQQARVLVSLDPHASEARWALVHALIRRGDLDAAWNALTPDGEPTPPRDRHDAMTWISLAARHDISTQFVPRALSTMSRWPDDEQLIGVFIGQIYHGLRRQGLAPSEEDLAALHAATADYTKRFPDSTVFRAVQISKEDPLAALAPELRARYEALNEILTQVGDGHLPLGLVAAATGLSYAEVSLRRAAGFVRCHNPAQQAQSREAVASALDRVVVLDTTAAHTLVLLDAETRSLLLGSFGQTQATDPAYRDASRGQESLGLRSTMSTTWDPVTGRPKVSMTEQSVADLLADQSSQLCTILRDAVRRPWHNMRHFGEGSDQFDWLASLDMAATEKTSYWCDDTVLRAVAASMGVQTFGTVDLLDYLQTQDRISHDLLSAIKATLISNFYADLGFDRATFDLAAAMDRWKPRGAAFAVARPTAWTHPAEVMEFVFSALNLRADEGPDDIDGWVSAAALGLVRITSDANGAGSNLRILLGHCMAQRWMRPDRLPSVLSAIRASLKERQAAADPLEPVLADTYQSLVSKHGYSIAASLLMTMVQHTSDTDRSTASRVVLTYPT